MTRDSADVVQLGFPVFAEGTKCRDVRGRATLDCINKPVTLHGVTVYPGDLVFADSEGIVVIPRNLEKKVLEAAFVVVKKEKSLLLDIANGVDVDQLVSRNGEF